MRRFLAKIKKLGFALSEAELVQIANLLPESDVELYLVSNFYCTYYILDIYLCLTRFIL
jgi:hypothetical protein